MTSPLLSIPIAARIATFAADRPRKLSAFNGTTSSWSEALSYDACSTIFEKLAAENRPKSYKLVRRVLQHGTPTLVAQIISTVLTKQQRYTKHFSLTDEGLKEYISIRDSWNIGSTHGFSRLHATPNHWGCQQPYPEHLVAQNRSPDAICAFAKQFPHILPAARCNLAGHTVLDAAARTANAPVVEWLLQQPFANDLYTPCYYGGHRPLLAVGRACYSVPLETTVSCAARSLISRSKRQRKSAETSATSFGERRVKTLAMLLDFAAEDNNKTRGISSTQHVIGVIAAETGEVLRVAGGEALDLELVRYLLEQRPDVKRDDAVVQPGFGHLPGRMSGSRGCGNLRYSLLHLVASKRILLASTALRQRRQQLARYLCEKHDAFRRVTTPDAQLRYHHGDSPLHHAVRSGDGDLVEYFVNKYGVCCAASPEYPIPRSVRCAAVAPANACEAAEMLKARLAFENEGIKTAAEMTKKLGCYPLVNSKRNTVLHTAALCGGSGVISDSACARIVGILLCAFDLQTPERRLAFFDARNRHYVRGLGDLCLTAVQCALLVGDAEKNHFHEGTSSPVATTLTEHGGATIEHIRAAMVNIPVVPHLPLTRSYLRQLPRHYTTNVLLASACMLCDPMQIRAICRFCGDALLGKMLRWEVDAAMYPEFRGWGFLHELFATVNSVCFKSPEAIGLEPVYDVVIAVCSCAAMLPSFSKEDAERFAFGQTGKVPPAAIRTTEPLDGATPLHILVTNSFWVLKRSAAVFRRIVAGIARLVEAKDNSVPLSSILGKLLGGIKASRCQTTGPKPCTVVELGRHMCRDEDEEMFRLDLVLLTSGFH